MATFIRYLLIAGFAYVIDMGGYYLLLQFGVMPVVANVMVKIVAAVCGFYLHRRFTYQIKSAADVRAHAKKYFGSALAYTPASSASLWLIMLVLPHPVYAKALSDILLFLLTFWITTKFTFTTTAAHHTESRQGS